MSDKTVILSDDQIVSWSQLSHSCQRCIDLSQSLRNILKDKTSRKTLILALLAQINDHVKQLQDGIKNLVANASETSHQETQYKNLMKQMEELIELEKNNHDLVCSQGIPLNLPKTYKFNQHPRD
tara:strand:- start:645 stop:1019 length:375 start_codon:yes stop_codon:yes gene_type:complete